MQSAYLPGPHPLSLPAFKFPELCVPSTTQLGPEEPISQLLPSPTESWLRIFPGGLGCCALSRREEERPEWGFLAGKGRGHPGKEKGTDQKLTNRDGARPVLDIQHSVPKRIL